MTNAPDPASFGAGMVAAIEAVLSGRSPWRLPIPLAAQYEARQGPERRRRISFVLALSGVLSALAIVMDTFGSRSRIIANLEWRLGVMLLCVGAACGLRCLRPGRKLVHAEAVLIAVPVIAIMMLTEFLGEYGGRYADRYMLAAIVLVAGLVVVTPIPFLATFCVCFGAILLFPLVPAVLPIAIPLQANWDLVVFSAGVLATAGFVARRNEIRRRIAFLYQYRYELSAAELMLMNVELSRLSTTDPLTGLRNRRAFSTVFGDHWRNTRQTLGVALIDVDWFKGFNDSAGHAAGDAALQAVARAIQAGLRSDRDLAARYGGEEFVVVMPGIGKEELRVVGERLRLGVKALAVPHPGRPGRSLSISVGLAWCAAPSRLMTIPDAMMHEADEALYAAKERGRDCVVLAGADHDRTMAGALSS